MSANPNTNPYAAPRAVVENAPIIDDNHMLSTTVRWLLYLQTFVSLVVVVFSILQYELLTRIQNGGEWTEQETSANDIRYGGAAGISCLLYLVNGILILIWIYRANRRVSALSNQGLSNSPGWSIGWYFVPIMNLWKPFVAMKEIWLASQSPKGWSMYDSAPALLGWWWALWLIGTFLGRAANGVSRMSGVDAVMQGTSLNAISMFLNAVLCILFAIIVSRIQSMQNAGQEEHEQTPESATSAREPFIHRF